MFLEGDRHGAAAEPGDFESHGRGCDEEHRTGDPDQRSDNVVAKDWNQAPWENGSGGPTSMPSSAAAKA